MRLEPKGFLQLVLGVFLFGCVAEAASDPHNQDIPLFINDIFIQAQGRLVEKQVGGFQPLEGRIGVTMTPATDLEATLKVGSSSFLGVPRWSVGPSQGLSLMEGKLEYSPGFGTFTMGQALLPFGLEGSQDEASLLFPRIFVYELGYLPLRDLQAGFHTDNGDGFFSSWAVHNGEGISQSSSDNRMFFTASLSYKKGQTAIGVSGMAGSLVPSANSQAVQTTGQAGEGPLMAANQENKLRAFSGFLGVQLGKLHLEGEAIWIQQINFLNRNETLDWYVTADQELLPRFNFIARYEGLDPDSRAADDFVSRSSVGFQWFSLHQNNRVILFGAKVLEQGHEVPNDEIRLVWRANIVNGDIW